MNNLDLTLSASGIKVDFEYEYPTNDELFLPHYIISINDRPQPLKRYDVVIDGIELIFYINDNRIQSWEGEYLTLDIALEIYKLILKS